MMERLLVATLVACLFFQATAYTEPTFTADKSFLQKQKNVYELFWHVNQPTVYHPELYQVSKTWSIMDHIDEYTNKEVVYEFLKLWKNGMLPRGELFNPWYPDLHDEMVALFDLFYFAKNFETFYNTAVWARFNMNEEMYKYVLAVAIIHRPDTKHIRLPNLYEIWPHHFFNEDVIFRAHRIKMGDYGAAKKAITGTQPYLLTANYTGWYLTHDHDSEWKLNHFTEDIGLNSLYFYFHLMFPMWMSSEKYHLVKDYRGELYYYVHKQIMARYNMERLSHDLIELEYIDWNKPIATGYYPSMIHTTGLPYPQRLAWSDVPMHKYKYLERINHIEPRVSMAIDSGLVMKKDKHFELYEDENHDMNTLGNMIQGNMDSPFRRFYDSMDRLSKNILGYGYERSTKYQTTLSTLDLSLTSMRDPGFYRIYKKILSFFHKYKSNIPMYTHDQLGFPGVKIESVIVDKMVTYLDYFDSMISNAVSVHSHKEAQSLFIKARQQRLNHKPYTYHITVHSEKAVKGWVRVFLGPKYDIYGHEIDMMDNWMNFFQMDYWTVDLKPGINKIERSSHESIIAARDEMPSTEFYNMILKAMEGSETYKYSSQMSGFPDRMMLPTGKTEGMLFKLFVHISPYDESKVINVDMPVIGVKHFESKPLGFPLDRPMLHYDKTVPNMYWKDVTIFHKNADESNLTAYSRIVGLSSRITMGGLLVATLATCLFLQTTAYTELTFTADKTFLQKQKSIYELFWHVNQPTVYHPELYQIAKTWSITDHIDDYTNKDVVTVFLKLWKNGMLPRGELFHPWYIDVHDEMVALFDLFYFAKDFETFYNTAVWARFNINEEMYKYVLVIATIHRPDTKHIRLPNIYEICPHYFFNEDVLFRAHRIKMGDYGVAKKTDTGMESYLLLANYTGWYPTHNHDSEWKLNYFTEDIGMNSLYFYIQTIFPSWLSSEKYNLLKDFRGEMYYYTHKQIMARYYMERLSHDLGELEYIDWNKPIVTGYYPSMVLPTGLPLAQRPTWSDIPTYKYEYLQRINSIESRISMAIDSGRVMQKEKHLNLYENEMQDLNILGNMIQGNMDSPFLRFYDSVDRLSKNILGYGHERSTKYQTPLSALDLSITSMRDPGFYRIYKKILDHFHTYKTNLPMYTYDQLVFSGVKIESVAVDKLVTYFDYFDSMISNAVSVHSHKEAQDLFIKARQHRLNHKPYTYHMTVNSDKPTKGWMHVFIGPKYDVHGHEIDMVDNWMNFFELDNWVVDLKSGTNKIERSSHESLFVSRDEMPSTEFYNMILKSMEGSETYKYSSQLHGFPDRMMLPRGKPEGMVFKLFFYISPYDEAKSIKVDLPVFGTKLVEVKPFGFPLDRPMYYYDKTVPNMYWKDVTIFHKNAEDLNVTV
ncbi:uncharacterized protein LOC117169851 [Belonocnema kinseyi]|uniref:uncharacterized protein LOC117169851 n=1 Tax=Belonocnema kinseyi TaxID=2817044 RepID=UPI00143DE210|nr:uncharacterized protein LOC117169851 [Belonocnema kinseyi]